MFIDITQHPAYTPDKLRDNEKTCMYSHTYSFIDNQNILEIKTKGFNKVHFQLSHERINVTE